MPEERWESLPDGSLAEVALAGRSEPCEELVRRHQAPVYSHLLRLVRNKDDAMELAQDVFLKAFAHLAQYDPARPFRTWLLSIATHTAFNHLEARRVRRIVSSHPEVEIAGMGADPGAARPASGRWSPPAQASRRELLERIDAALVKLSDKARAIFQLRYHQGLSCEEVSRASGESLSNVKVSLLRTRERLRQELGEGIGI